jgi:hypothetical protein
MAYWLLQPWQRVRWWASSRNKKAVPLSGTASMPSCVSRSYANDVFPRAVTRGVNAMFIFDSFPAFMSYNDCTCEKVNEQSVI